MEVTMLFGFLTNKILSTIGVAWTLGVIFHSLFSFFTAQIDEQCPL